MCWHMSRVVSHRNSFGELSSARVYYWKHRMNSAQPMSLKCGSPAIQKGGAQSARALGYRSKGGDVTFPSGDWEGELFTECTGRQGKQAPITAWRDLIRKTGEVAGQKSQGDLDCATPEIWLKW